MDASHKKISSSASNQPPVMSKFSDSGETNENSQNNFQMGSKLQNPKKTTAKHFMSPTISAASKAVVLRKKILAERNEASESILPDTHFKKTPDGSFHNITPLSPRVSEFDGDQESTYLSPYDPLTNYLSPRPQFLRYKPRRRQLLLRGEDEEGKHRLIVDEGDFFDPKKVIYEESPVVSCGTSPSSSPKKQGDEKTNESDEEFEEAEETAGWNFKGVLKTLLVFAVLVLSTFYISSMNSPTPSPALQAIRGLQDNILNIQNHLFGAASLKRFEGGIESFDHFEDTQMAPVEVGQGVIGIEDMVQNTDDEEDGSEFFDQLEDTQRGPVEVGQGVIGIEDMVQNTDDEEDGSEFFDQLEDTQRGPEEVYRGAIDIDEMVQNADNGESEGVETVENESQGSGDGLNVSNHEMENTGKVSDQIDENIKWQGIETGYDTLFDVANASEEKVNAGENTKYGKEDQVGIVDEGDRAEDMLGIEMEGVDDTPDKAAEVHMDNELINPEVGVNSLEQQIQYSETKQIPKAAIGVSVISVIVASLILGYYLKRRKNLPRDCSPSVLKPCSESVIPEKNSIVHPNEVEDKPVVNVDRFVDPSSLMHSMASNELYASWAPTASQAPTVELLGEFVVGEFSSSFNSSSMRRRMSEHSEGEESSHSLSPVKRLRSKARSVSNSKPSPSEFSAMDSPSYGSFTTEEKILRKEDGEAKKVVTTPVRRSSRIRNRAMSP